MTLQELLLCKGIDLKKTKLIRHIIRKDNEANYRNYTDICQSMQSRNFLKGYDFVVSFKSMENAQGKYHGCYKVIGCEDFRPELLPKDFDINGVDIKSTYFWKMKKTDILIDMVDRLVIDWGKSTSRHEYWHQDGTNTKEILYILPVASEFNFISYDKVLLSYDALKQIVDNNKEHKIWVDRLSAVAGVYLITDTKTGKHYIGSASSKDDGIWGRWSSYARTKHGDNKRLIELIDNDKDYCKKFAVLKRTLEAINPK